MSEEQSEQPPENTQEDPTDQPKAPPELHRPPVKKPIVKPVKASENKAGDNKIVKLLERNPLGLTLPEMAGGPRQLKKIRSLRPLLADAIKNGVVMPVSQRAGHTVYRLVKNLGPR
jgi:hypothetical protein